MIQKHHKWAGVGLLAGVVGTAAVFGTAVKAPEKPGGGIERWSVKTGTDSGAQDVKTSVPITVGRLILFSRGNVPSEPNRQNLDDPTRYAPYEYQSFKVMCVIRGYKKESDDDFHIVISDPNSENTMIAEIPDPEDVHGSSPFLEGIKRSRQAFLQRFSGVSERYVKCLPPVNATVTGVGFFDYLHGQIGVAKNGFELHPVTNIVFE